MDRRTRAQALAGNHDIAAVVVARWRADCRARDAARTAGRREFWCWLALCVAIVAALGLLACGGH